MSVARTVVVHRVPTFTSVLDEHEQVLAEVFPVAVEGGKWRVSIDRVGRGLYADRHVAEQAAFEHLGAVTTLPFPVARMTGPMREAHEAYLRAQTRAA